MFQRACARTSALPLVSRRSMVRLLYMINLSQLCAVYVMNQLIRVILLFIVVILSVWQLLTALALDIRRRV